MMVLAAVALLVVLPHANSLSRSEVTVRGAEAQVWLHCQVASMLEVIEGLDADGDGVVVATELLAKEAEVADYVGRHYRLSAGTDRAWGGGRELAPEPLSVRPGDPDPEAPPWLRDWIDVEMRFEDDRAIDDLLVAVSLFRDTSPDHIDVCTVAFEGRDDVTVALGPTAPRQRVDPVGAGALPWYARLGARHGVAGWEHVAAALALLVAARSRGAVVVLAAALLGAHAAGVVVARAAPEALAGRAALCEAATVLAIGYVAADALLEPEARRVRLVEVGLVGLAHGLAVGGWLGPALAVEAAPGRALVGFHAGLAAALALVAGAGLALGALASRGGPAPLAPAPRRALAAALLVAGLLGFALRVL